MDEETTVDPAQDNTEAPVDEKTSFLPDDLQGNEALTGFKDPGELATAYLEKTTAYDELEKGHKPPDTPDAYELEIENEDDLKVFRQVSHESGLTQKQAVALAGKLAEINKANEAEHEKALKDARTEAEASLKKDWGDAFDANVEGAKKIVRTIGDENLSKWLDDTHMGDIIPLIRFCYKVSTLISEDSLEEGGHKTEPQRTEDGRPMLNYGSMEA